MSGDARSAGVPGGGREGLEADLLQWVVDPERRAATPRSELVAQHAGDERAATDARLSELEAFVARCRTACLALDADAAGGERALVERVLASTTREDLSWRGDLRLVRGYLAHGLRKSLLLRIVAASLLVHALAVPVIAWYALRKPAPAGLLIDLLPPPEPLTSEGPETLPELESSSPPEVFELPDTLQDEHYVLNSIRWARHTALRGVPALPPASGEEPDALVLLRARLALAASGPLAAASPTSAASATARALRVELLLDRFLRARTPDAELEAALAELRDARGFAEPERRLALSALARAESYGLLAGAARDTLGQARLDRAGTPDPGGLVGSAGDLRQVAPFAPDWLALCAACGEREAWPRPVLDALRAAH